MEVREDTKLKLTVGIRNKKNVITEEYFTSPLKIGTPNVQGDRLKIVLMMASAGILKGDTFQYKITCEQDTKVFLTEQSYTKIFDTGEGMASKSQKITLKEGASLYYRPCATIPFQNSHFEGDITIELSQSSEFAFADIVTAGRVGMGEKFAMQKYHNRVCVIEDGKPVWIDHCLLLPEQMDLEGMLFFDGYTHQGTFYYHGTKEKEEVLLQFVPNIAEDIQIGISQATCGICIRMLAYTAQDIEDIFLVLEKSLDLDV